VHSVTEATYWKKLTKIGWLRYVPKHLHAELRDRLRTCFKSEPEWVHLELHRAGFDAECIDGEESYCKLLRDLKRDSIGIFRPSQIEARMVAKGRRMSIHISFRHKRKPYSCVVPFESDYVEHEVMDLVNRALESSGREERFIPLPVKGQLVFLAIVPPVIYDKAVTAGLIPAVV
jgi:hypothetical protein